MERAGRRLEAKRGPRGFLDLGWAVGVGPARRRLVSSSSQEVLHWGSQLRPNVRPRRLGGGRIASAAEKVCRIGIGVEVEVGIGIGQAGHVFHIWVYLMEIEIESEVVVAVVVDLCELVGGWRAVGAAMEAESEPKKKAQSSCSLGPLQEAFRPACRGDSDAESSSTARTARTMSGWSVIGYTERDWSHSWYYGRVSAGTGGCQTVGVRKGDRGILGDLSVVITNPGARIEYSELLSICFCGTTEPTRDTERSNQSLGCVTSLLTTTTTTGQPLACRTHARTLVDSHTLFHPPITRLRLPVV